MGTENRGKQNCYVSALTQTGERIKEAIFHFGYNDYLHIGNENKPANEPQDNFSMWFNVGNNYFISAGLDGTMTGDMVKGLGTSHPDSPGKGNSLGHHSFFVVFVLGEKSEEPIQPPEELPDIISIEGELDGLITGNRFRGIIKDIKWIE